MFSYVMRIDFISEDINIQEAITQKCPRFSIHTLKKTNLRIILRIEIYTFPLDIYGGQTWAVTSL